MILIEENSITLNMNSWERGKEKAKIKEKAGKKTTLIENHRHSSRCGRMRQHEISRCDELGGAERWRQRLNWKTIQKNFTCTKRPSRMRVIRDIVTCISLGESASMLSALGMQVGSISTHIPSFSVAFSSLRDS